jgi:hypothetical protein
LPKRKEKIPLATLQQAAAASSRDGNAVNDQLGLISRNTLNFSKLFLQYIKSTLLHSDADSFGNKSGLCVLKFGIQSLRLLSSFMRKALVLNHNVHFGKSRALLSDSKLLAPNRMVLLYDDY